MRVRDHRASSRPATASHRPRRAACSRAGRRLATRLGDLHRARRSRPAWRRARRRDCCSRSSATGWSGARTTARFRPGDAFVRYALRGERRDRPRRRRPALPRAARRADRRDDQPRRRPAAAWWSRSPRSTASTCSAARTGWAAPMPLHCTALGKVLLAYGAAELPAGRLERADTARPITSRTALEAELSEVRAARLRRRRRGARTGPRRRRGARAPRRRGRRRRPLGLGAVDAAARTRFASRRQCVAERARCAVLGRPDALSRRARPPAPTGEEGAA